MCPKYKYKTVNLKKSKIRNKREAASRLFTVNTVASDSTQIKGYFVFQRVAKMTYKAKFF